MRKKLAESCTCEYCEHPERYNLAPVRVESTTESSVLDKVIRFAGWHYEVVVYCRDVPRTRVRCQKSVPGSK